MLINEMKSLRVFPRVSVDGAFPADNITGYWLGAKAFSESA